MGAVPHPVTVLPAASKTWSSKSSVYDAVPVVQICPYAAVEVMHTATAATTLWSLNSCITDP